ncbi:MAG: SCP2 sterol-binding domain-containing protein [Phototrophicaceae bacterium]
MAVSRDDVRALFEKMQGRFNAQKAEGLDVTIQFSLSGEAASEYWAKIKDGTVQLNEGTSDSPNMTLIADAEDYAGVLKGEANAMQAFMRGQIKVKGDMGLAMKLQAIFGL